MNLRLPISLTGTLAFLLLAAGPACGTKAQEPAQPATASTGGAPAQPPAPVPAQPPPPIPVRVPAGTHLKVALSRGLSTDKDWTGDHWDGTLTAAVVVAGQEVWPRGAAVRGVIAQSAPAGRLKGSGGLGIRVIAVDRKDVKTGIYRVAGASRGARNAKFIGGTAAVGALVGILTSRDHQADHALGGAAVGAAAGTGLAAGTADTVIRIPAGKTVVFSLTVPEQVLQK